MIRHAAFAMLLLGSAGLALAEGRHPLRTLGFTSGQEAVLLEANRITDAAERCDFTIDDAAMDALLRGAAVGMADMEIRTMSRTLKDEVAADRTSYAKDKRAACARAMADYGPSGTAGRFLSK